MDKNTNNDVNYSGSDNDNYSDNNSVDSTLEEYNEYRQNTNKSAFPHNNTVEGYNIFSGISNENYPGSEEHMVNTLINTKDIPAKISEKYWWVFSKDIILTFLDKERKKQKLLSFDISRIDYLLTLPYYDYTFEVEHELNTVRSLLDVRLDRALGTENSNQINERIAQKSQFVEQKQTISNENGNEPGLFAKLLRRRN